MNQNRITPNQPPPDIFDRAKMAVRRARLLRQAPGQAFLNDLVADHVVERLGDIRRSWDRILLMGYNPVAHAALQTHARRIDLVEPGIAAAPEMAAAALSATDGQCWECDFDRLIPSLSGPYDLIVWASGLDQTNDVPGALVQCRRLLREDGLLIGAFFGGGSLPFMRRSFAQLDEPRPAARFHPQIDVRAMGDLLQRTGFALPTVDCDILALRYPDITRLHADLRSAALTNMLAGATAPLRKADVLRLQQLLHEQCDTDGRISEQFHLVHFVGWAPHPSQPRPARRGSATASLAQLLDQPRGSNPAQGSTPQQARGLTRKHPKDKT